MENHSLDQSESQRFGPRIERFLLPIVYYIWEWSTDKSELRSRLDRSTDRSRKELLAAVLPFSNEIEFVLEDEQLSLLETRLMNDFVRTFEAVLELVAVSIDEIPENWDVSFITQDKVLCRALLKVYRGLDIISFGVFVEGKEIFLDGFKRLNEISNRRLLPSPLLRFIKEAKASFKESQVTYDKAIERGLAPQNILSVSDVLAKRESQVKSSYLSMVDVDSDDVFNPKLEIKLEESNSRENISAMEDNLKSSESGISQVLNPRDQRLFPPCPDIAIQHSILIDLIKEVS